MWVGFSDSRTLLFLIPLLFPSSLFVRWLALCNLLFNHPSQSQPNLFAAASTAEKEDEDEPLEDDREDDAASRTASSREPDGDCTSAPEPVAKDCDGRVEPIQKIFSR